MNSGTNSNKKIPTVTIKETTNAISNNPAPQIIPTPIDQNKNNKSMGFLIAVLNGDVAEQGRISTELGMLSEALVDEINEISFDVFGDVLIEDDGDGYKIIEEYKEQITGGSSNE